MLATLAPWFGTAGLLIVLVVAAVALFAGPRK